jgi:hypothetical protein
MNYLNGRGLRCLTAHLLVAAVFSCSFSAIVQAQRIAKKDDANLSKLDDGSGLTAECSPAKFVLEGNSSSDGTDGNIRTFTASGVSVKASAFSRRNNDGVWQNGYLGAFPPGVGVTNRGEGDGTDGSHRVDNIGDRKDYVLFEFDVPVVVDRVYLESVEGDSDVTVWVGNATDPFNNHVTLSDSVLSGFGPAEDNDTSSTSARYADINSGLEAGNILVVAASTSDADPEDQFKIRYLDIECPVDPCSAGEIKTVGDSPGDGTDGNSRTFTNGGVQTKARAFSRRKDNGLWETAYLGAFSPGLGVTDRGEDGETNSHKVDSVGNRLNYVVFGFNQNVVIDRAYLDSIGADSDITVWIGSAADPFNNPITLSDSVLAGFGAPETNDGSTSARWANVNSSQKIGNVVVIAAKTNDPSANDEFKIQALDIDCAPPNATVTIIKEVATANGGTAAVTAFEFTSTNFGASTFSLVDNNVVGPDRRINSNITQFGAANAITVTESFAGGWTLLDINCTETGGIQNSSIDFANRKATLIPESGENIVCTFRNGLLTPSAAPATISGRVLMASGTGLSRAVLTLTNAENGETITTTTNSFGYYSIEAEVGPLYTLSVSHRRYSFADNLRIFTLLDEMSGMDFVQSF